MGEWVGGLCELIGDGLLEWSPLLQEGRRPPRYLGGRPGPPSSVRWLYAACHWRRRRCLLSSSSWRSWCAPQGRLRPCPGTAPLPWAAGALSAAGGRAPPSPWRSGGKKGAPSSNPARSRPSSRLAPCCSRKGPPTVLPKVPMPTQLGPPRGGGMADQERVPPRGAVELGGQGGRDMRSSARSRGRWA